eukprot:3937138-Rhodomonas_salina.1
MVFRGAAGRGGAVVLEQEEQLAQEPRGAGVPRDPQPAAGRAQTAPPVGPHYTSQRALEVHLRRLHRQD